MGRRWLDLKKAEMKIVDWLRTRAQEIKEDREKVNEWLKERVKARLTEVQRAELTFLEVVDERAAKAKPRQYGYRPYRWWNSAEGGELDLDWSTYEKYMEYVRARKAAKRRDKRR